MTKKIQFQVKIHLKFYFNKKKIKLSVSLHLQGNSKLLQDIKKNFKIFFLSIITSAIMSFDYDEDDYCYNRTRFLYILR